MGSSVSWREARSDTDDERGCAFLGLVFERTGSEVDQFYLSLEPSRYREGLTDSVYS